MAKPLSRNNWLEKAEQVGITPKCSRLGGSIGASTTYSAQSLPALERPVKVEIAQAIETRRLLSRQSSCCCRS